MLRSWPITTPLSLVLYISGPKPSNNGKLVTSPGSQGVMLLKDVSGKELRFDGTEWQDLGVNGHITNYIDEYSLVIPVPESFSTSQCCDYDSCLNY